MIECKNTLIFTSEGLQPLRGVVFIASYGAFPFCCRIDTYNFKDALEVFALAHPRYGSTNDCWKSFCRANGNSHYCAANAAYDLTDCSKTGLFSIIRFSLTFGQMPTSQLPTTAKTRPQPTAISALVFHGLV